MKNNVPSKQDDFVLRAKKSSFIPRLSLVYPPTALMIALTLAIPALLHSKNVYAEDDPLLNLSLEELVEFRLTSMARKTQNITDVSAAAHVITADEIRRSGATTIAEAL